VDSFSCCHQRLETVRQFFQAKTKEGNTPSVFLLTSSLVISWIFAKSIANAANLGMAYGIVGGIAYACYYLSFLTGGLVIYYMRKKGHFESIHQFLRTRYGRQAVRLFSLVIGFRLFNEVWSNTTVIGNYFGPPGSSSFYIAVLVFTGLTLAYTLKGGMRTSLITDSIQMLFFAVLLFILLFFILTQKQCKRRRLYHIRQLDHGGRREFVTSRVIQIFSYPFHDPVLTDRGFMSSP
jgi:Na+/proline symporter